MKNYLHFKIIGFILVSLAFLSSCELTNDYEGNGNVTRERKSVSNFDEIDIDGVLDVYLQQGSTYKLEVVTDENLQKIVEPYTIDNVLYVDTETDKEYDATQMDIYITMPDIKKIRLDGVTALYTPETMELTTVEIEKVNTGHLNFNANLNSLSIVSQGVGDVELLGKGTEVSIQNEMVGDIKAFGFKVYNLDLVHAGTGSVEVYVTNNFDVNISGVGDVYCKGNPVNINNTGENITGHLIMVE